MCGRMDGPLNCLEFTLFCFLENVINDRAGKWFYAITKSQGLFKIVQWFLYEYFSITPPLSLSPAYGTEVWYDKSEVTHASFWPAALPVAHTCLELFTNRGERSQSSAVLHLILHLTTHNATSVLLAILVVILPFFLNFLYCVMLLFQHEKGLQN